MHIHPAGCDQPAFRRHIAPRRAGLAAYLRDAITINGDIASITRRAEPIHNGAAANNDIMHGVSPSGLLLALA
jgi:hypothetical protein